MLAVAISIAVTFISTSYAATPKDAEAFAASIGTRVLEILKESDKSQDEKLSTLENMFTETMDVEWVGKFVLGKYWRSATPPQRESYMDAYRAFLIKHYTSRFAEYSGQTFNMVSSREERKGEFLVRMNISRTQGEPVIVDYRLREEKDSTTEKPTFKAFDIIVEGVSLINTQRSEFNTVVGREGIDSLTRKLKAKTTKLATQMKQAKQ